MLLDGNSNDVSSGLQIGRSHDALDGEMESPIAVRHFLGSNAEKEVHLVAGMLQIYKTENRCKSDGPSLILGHETTNSLGAIRSITA